MTTSRILACYQNPKSICFWPNSTIRHGQAATNQIGDLHPKNLPQPLQHVCFQRTLLQVRRVLDSSGIGYESPNTVSALGNRLARFGCSKLFDQEVCPHLDGEEFGYDEHDDSELSDAE